MPYWMECIIGTMAAIGLICILQTVYAIMRSSYVRAHGRAVLVLRGDGSAPESERLLLAAAESRRYLPGVEIVFLEQQLCPCPNNLAARTAARCGAVYRQAPEKDGFCYAGSTEPISDGLRHGVADRFSE